MKKYKLWLFILLILITLLSIVYMNFLIFRYRLIAFKFLNFYVLGGSIILSLLIIIFAFNKKTKTLAVLLSIITLLLSLVGNYYISTVVNKFSLLNNTSTIKESIKIVALKDSPVETIKDLDNKLYTAQNEDQNKIEQLLNQLNNQEKLTFKTQSYEDYNKLYTALKEKEIESMIITDQYLSLLEAQDASIQESIKTIYEYEISTKVEQQVKKSTNKYQFHVYLSGIDTFGQINTVSRSDVNIIASVNLETGKIILTTTPRDAYVQIPDGGKNQYDKLTHAGIYGTHTSVKTLENVYDIHIPYYMRVNFTSFIDIINVIGNIEVENTQAFTARHGGHYFPVGKIQLDAEQALGFVRERYSLVNGDIDRGKNQIKVIEAIIKKMAKPSTISNIGSLLDKLTQSVQTNIEIGTMMDWVNYQLNHNKKLDIESVSLKATGQSGLSSFAMPGYNLYMSVIDKDHLETIKKLLNDTVQK